MKFFYLIKGWDMNTWQQFTPTPGLFKTEEEAVHFCKTRTVGGVYYTYEKILLGKFELKK